MGNKCHDCGAELEWDSESDRCDDCYRKNIEEDET